MARRKRRQGDQIFYARGRRSDTRGDSAGYFAPERSRRVAEDEPKTSEEPVPDKSRDDDPKID